MPKQWDSNRKGYYYYDGCYRSLESIEKRKAKRKERDKERLKNPENRETERTRRKKYYRENKEREIARKREYIKRNREEYNAKKRAYYHENRERLLGSIYRARVRRNPAYGLSMLVRQLETGELKIDQVIGRISEALNEIRRKLDE